MFTVFGRATSINVQAVVWTLAELGLPFERLDFGHSYGGLETPEYLAMNPNGLVPVLRDEQVTMFESGAILRYLANRYARFPFWPEDPVARAPVDMWAEWGKSTLQPGFLMPIFWPVMRTAPDARPAGFDASLAAFERNLGILAAQIGDGPWVLGDAFTLADIQCGSLLYRYYTLDLPRSEIPGIAAYYARLSERPGYAEHVMVNYDVLRPRPDGS